MMDDDFDIHEERFSQGEKDFENALRPLSFSDFSGQKKIVENLEVFVEAAKYRGEPLDHTLLHGPPGLGKTTLSNIIANELGVGFKITSGPVLDKPGDLAGILTSLEKNDVLFIDEIHRLSPVVEEYLYSAMEDYRIDIMIDKGPSARSIQIDLNPFTLVGATTRSGLLTAPLRARFGINMHLEYYEPETLQAIIERSANILGVPITEDAALEIAGRSRGTPRIANALLRRVRDFAQVKGNGKIDTKISKIALTALNIDQYGLDEIDNKILLTIIDKFRGGPVGITTIASVTHIAVILWNPTFLINKVEIWKEQEYSLEVSIHLPSGTTLSYVVYSLCSIVWSSASWVTMFINLICPLPKLGCKLFESSMPMSHASA